MASSLSGNKVYISVLKNYGDLKYLYEFIKATQLELGAGALPALPEKHSASGVKLDTEEMMLPI